MTREKIAAERARLAARAQRRQRERIVDERRSQELELLSRRLDLEAMVGVPSGVMLRFTGAGGRIPDDATGTLIKINRTRCLVDFGEHGSNWSIPIDNLIESSKADQRGFVLRLGAA